MPRHTNNAALNKAAQRERERLRKEADSKESDLLLIAYLQGREDAADKYRDRITELEVENERLKAELAVRDKAMEILAEARRAIMRLHVLV